MSQVETGEEQNSELLRLAKSYLDLEKAHHRFFNCVNMGKTFEGRQEDNIVEASHLHWLCTNPAASKLVTHRGIAIRKAKISGKLDLEYADIQFPLWFKTCEFDEVLQINSARLAALHLVDSTLPGIIGYNAQIAGSVWLSDMSTFTGEVNFRNAHIGGMLKCSQGHFLSEDEFAIRADGLTVKGTVYFDDKFKATSRVILKNATIGGSLECSDGSFSVVDSSEEKDKYAFCAIGIGVRGEVKLDGEFSCVGGVVLDYASIGGHLYCSGGKFSNEKGDALSAFALVVGGGMYLNDGFESKGIVYFSNSSIDGHLDCANSSFYSDPTKRNSLHANGLNVKGGVYLCIVRNERLEQGLVTAFYADGDVCLKSATIGGHLNCSGGKFTNEGRNTLNADGLNTSGDVYLNDGFISTGTLILARARIGGNLDCSSGKFNNSIPQGLIPGINSIRKEVRNSDDTAQKSFNHEELSYSEAGKKVMETANGRRFEAQIRGEEALAINLTSITAQGSVLFTRSAGGLFEADGEVRLDRSTIGGDIHCVGSEFRNEGGDALSVCRARIHGSVYMYRDVLVKGNVYFSSSTIDCSFNLQKLREPGLYKLFLDSTTIGTLVDDYESWPHKKKLTIAGMRFEHLQRLTPDGVKTHIAWLERQKNEESSLQAYEHLSKVLKNSGDEHHARIVRYKMEERRTQYILSQLRRVGHRLFGWTIGYGQRPVFWTPVIAFLVILLGSAMFFDRIEPGYLVQAKGASGQVPEFNSLLYSIDLFLPVINLHQAEFWVPQGFSSNPALQLWFLIQILAGWILSTFFVVGLSKIIRS